MPYRGPTARAHAVEKCRARFKTQLAVAAPPARPGGRSPMVTSWLLVAAAIVLVGASGLFVAAEFSLVTVSRTAVEQAAARGEPGAAGILAAIRSLSTQLSGAQVGITITNLLIGWLAEPSIARL